MPTPRTSLGDFGERAAEAYLTRRGYHVIARKWRCPHGEIDLVLRAPAAGQSDRTLVFAEVRTRRGASPAPEESIGAAKRRRLAALAYAYLEAAGLPDETPWRIDVIAIAIDQSGRVTTRHIPHAIEE